MIQNEKGEMTVTIDLRGQGEYVLNVQQALLLGIEKIGTCDAADLDDHKDAVWILSDLLRHFMLDLCQTQVGLGGRPNII